MTFKEWERKQNEAPQSQFFCKEEKKNIKNTTTLFLGEGGHLFPDFRFLRGWSWMITPAKKESCLTYTFCQPKHTSSHYDF